MEADDDRIDAKTQDAVVIDLDEVRRRRDMTPDILKTLRDPVSESLHGLLVLGFVVVVVMYFWAKR